MHEVRTELSPERRAGLARRGEILYGKSCGTAGRGLCAESFAIHQIRIGNVEVVEDFVRFLDVQAHALRQTDPDDRLAMTEALAGRVRRHLVDEG